MNKSIDGVCHNRKWVREPLNHTRIVVIAAGVDDEYLALMHHGFSCFSNIALLHIDRKPVELSVVGGFSPRSATRTNTSLVGSAISACAFYVFVNGALDDWFLHDLPLQEASIYQLSADTSSERSIIEAVEHIKSQARVAPTPWIEFEPIRFRTAAV